MAEHFFPDIDKKPWISFIINNKLKPYAIEADKLLSRLHQLKVWEIQRKGQGYADNALYVGMASKNKPYLLNFKIIPSNLCVEFRFSQYLPDDIFELLKWQNTSWRYGDLKSFGIDRIKGMIERYIENIRSDFDAELLKPGGRSFAEEMIYKALKDIYPAIHIKTNLRPDKLRKTPRSKPLELDLFIEEKQLAIEVQGPQHFKEIYGSNIDLQNNDQFKKKWCRENNIKLIWMDWEGINILMKNKHPTVFLKNYLQNLINCFINSEKLFLWWQNSENHYWD